LSVAISEGQPKLLLENLMIKSSSTLKIMRCIQRELDMVGLAIIQFSLKLAKTTDKWLNQLFKMENLAYAGLKICKIIAVW